MNGASRRGVLAGVGAVAAGALVWLRASDGRAAPAQEATGPAMSEAEIEAFGAWYRGLARPAVALRQAGSASAPAGSRIGGRPWLPTGEAWPVDAKGEPLGFLAQLDLGTLPHLPDFPSAGLLQAFIGRDDLYGADFDAPFRSGMTVIYRSGTLEEGATRVPPYPVGSSGTYPGDFSPLMPRVEADGIALTGERVTVLPDWNDWRVAQRLDGLWRPPGHDRIEAIMEDAGRPFHHLGGYPAFTQTDPRSAGKLDEFDTTLLRFTSDDLMMWGDVGEAAFMMRREDLIRRDFSRILYNWDCH